MVIDRILIHDHCDEAGPMSRWTKFAWWESFLGDFVSTNIDGIKDDWSGREVHSEEPWSYHEVDSTSENWSTWGSSSNLPTYFWLLYYSSIPAKIFEEQFFQVPPPSGAIDLANEEVQDQEVPAVKKTYQDYLEEEEDFEIDK